MIKINLLPQQSRSKVSNSAKQMVLLAVLLFFVLVSVLGVNFWIGGRLADMQSRKSSLKKQYNKLESQVKEVKGLKKEVDALRDKIKVIRDIRKKQGLPIIYIDQVVKVLPGNRIWLDSFSLSAKGQMSLSGVALDNQSFAQYVKKLRQSEYIQEVVTEQTSRKQVNGYDLVGFDCRIEAFPGKEGGA
ncbi:MAG: PilN domain-containing protein [Thermodesulfobacteriota bacterium]